MLNSSAMNPTIRPWVPKTGTGNERRRLASPRVHLVIRDFRLQQRAHPVKHFGQLAFLERTGQEIRSQLQVGLELEEERSIRVEEEGIGIAERFGEICHIRAELPSRARRIRVNRETPSAVSPLAEVPKSAREVNRLTMFRSARRSRMKVSSCVALASAIASSPCRTVFFSDRLALIEMMAVSRAQGISEMIRNQSSNWVVMVIRESGAKACRKVMAGYT